MSRRLTYVLLCIKSSLSRVHRRVIRSDCRSIGSPTAFLYMLIIPYPFCD